MRRSDKKKMAKGIPIDRSGRQKPAQGKGAGEQKVDQQGHELPPGIQNKKVVGQMRIIVYDDLDVDVMNFPTDHGLAMMALCNGLIKVSQYFMAQQQKNASPIVVAKPGVSMADIEKMTRNN